MLKVSGIISIVMNAGSVIARAAGLRSWGAVGAAQARELNESSARLLEPRPECVYAT